MSVVRCRNGGTVVMVDVSSNTGAHQTDSVVTVNALIGMYLVTHCDCCGHWVAGSGYKIVLKSRFGGGVGYECQAGHSLEIVSST